MDVFTESSGIDTSPDMNSSTDLPEDFPSPDRLLKPRTLTYDESDEPIGCSENNNFLNNNNVPRNKLMDDDDDDSGILHRMHIRKSICRPSVLQAPKLQLESPPYRKVRSLR